VVTAVRQVSYAQGSGGDLEDVRKKVQQTIHFEALRRRFDGGNQDSFDQA
jgi:hypothetical protein